MSDIWNIFKYVTDNRSISETVSICCVILIFITPLKMTCSINDYVTVVIVLGGFIISEILPHCPGVEANGILHFLTLLLKSLAEVNKKVEDEGKS